MHTQPVSSAEVTPPPARTLSWPELALPPINLLNAPLLAGLQRVGDEAVGTQAVPGVAPTDGA